MITQLDHADRMVCLCWGCAVATILVGLTLGLEYWFGWTLGSGRNIVALLAAWLVIFAVVAFLVAEFVEIIGTITDGPATREEPERRWRAF